MKGDEIVMGHMRKSDWHNGNGHSSAQRPVLVVLGTRPEAIKLCPVVLALRDAGLSTRICSTGQHREMIDEVLSGFGLQADFELHAMRPGQTLSALTAKLVSALGKLLDRFHPSMLIVQGDTTTTLCGAMAAFYAQVPVAHVEAGLRSFDKNAPFPEEMNRILSTRLAGLHFAPTEWAANNLRDEGIPSASIITCGISSAGCHPSATPSSSARDCINSTTSSTVSFRSEGSSAGSRSFEKLSMSMTRL